MKKIITLTLISSITLSRVFLLPAKARISNKCNLYNTIIVGVVDGSVTYILGDEEESEEEFLCGRAIEAFEQEYPERGIQIIENLLEQRWFDGASLVISSITSDVERESIRISPSLQARLSILEGKLYWQQGIALPYRIGLLNLKKAQEHWEMMLDEQLPDLLYYNALGFAHYSQKNWQEAAKTWCQALFLIERHQPSVSLCQSIDFSSPRTVENSENEMLFTNTDSQTTYAGLALVLYQLGWENSSSEQKEEAIQLQKKIVTEAPNRFNLEALSQNWLWTDTALKNWRRMRKREPAMQSCFVPERVEQLTEETEELQQKITSIRTSERDSLCLLGTRVILSESQKIQALMVIIEEFFRRGDLNEVDRLLLAAILSSNKSLRFDPDFSWNFRYASGKWNWLVGRSVPKSLRNSQFNSSRTYWTRTLGEITNEPLYYNTLGFAKFMLSKDTEAIELWCKALSLLEEKQPEISLCSPVDGQNIPILTTERAADINSSGAPAYAGLTLALFLRSQAESSQSQSQLEEALSLQQQAIEKYPEYFQLDALQNNWLWTKELLSAWQTLQGQQR